MAIQKFTKQKTNELKQQIIDLQAELFKLKFKNSTGQLAKTHKIKMIKRQIAKLLTTLKLKQKTMESK